MISLQWRSHQHKQEDQRKISESGGRKKQNKTGTTLSKQCTVQVKGGEKRKAKY